MKKIVAMLLSLSFCFGMVSGAYAEGEQYKFKTQVVENEGKCHGVIQAYVGKKLKWEFKTEEGTPTELNAVSEVYENNETAYFAANSKLYALDIKTGDVKWIQNGVGGSNSICFDEKGSVYVSGYYGPNVVVFSKDGDQLYIDNDGSYCWVDSLAIEGTTLKIHYNLDDMGNDDGIKTLDINKVYEALEKLNEIKVTLNDKRIEFDQPPVIIDGRTLVPIRAVMEEMGGVVNWLPETKTVEIFLGLNKMQLVLDSQTAFYNGEAHVLDVAPQIINSRTVLPLRFVSEKFGFNVDWDNDTRTVIITK